MPVIMTWGKGRTSVVGANSRGRAYQQFKVLGWGANAGIYGGS